MTDDQWAAMAYRGSLKDYGCGGLRGRTWFLLGAAAGAGMFAVIMAWAELARAYF